MGCCTTVLTPQEQWLQGGAKEITGRERILRINNELRKKPVRIDINRARLFTESFKETEGQQLSLRWAKAMKHVAEKLPIYIAPDELLVGKITNELGRNCILYPEIDGASLLELKNADKRVVNPYVVWPEDMKVIEEEIYPYWKDKSYGIAYVQALPSGTRDVLYGEDRDNFSKQQYVICQSTTSRSSSNYNFDYETALKRGIESYKSEAENMLAQINKDPARYVEEGAFWEAAIISCEALSTFIERYAKEAEYLAKQESDIVRRNELMQIYETCAWVAHNPARDFRSALQLQWFMHLYIRLEQNVGAALGTARMDQHLLPYYRQDIKNGTITLGQAKELLENYWINLCQVTIGFVPESNSKLFEAYAHFETVTIGGQTKNGDDATNELSYLILESKRGLPVAYPDLAARIHSGTPEKFLHACAEVIKEGQGFPKLINDEEVIPLYLAKGMTYAEALDYAISGCTETRIVNKETYINGGPFLNLGAIIELTMNNGRFKFLDNKQFGPKTGEPETFKTFEQFFEAYRQQHEFILHHALVQQMIADKIKPTKLAAPFSSVLIGACREHGLDINNHIPNTFREVFVDQVGFATLVDSIVAVKKLIYDDKKITMRELVDALEANFEGYEAVRELLLHAPKYGNNNSYADEIGRMVDKVPVEYFSHHRGTKGDLVVSRLVPVTIHIPSGMVVGATPDGRKAGDYLSEGCSASHGADQNGPTGILLSNKAVKNEGYKERAARLLNIKLSPASMAGEEGTKKLMALIRAWCDLRLWHVQFNIVNKETLIAAKNDPEHYKDLIVRVAGYSAYFNDLSPILKDELIERSELAI